MSDQTNTAGTRPLEHGRRRFLIGAAGVAATPLVAGLAGCTTGNAAEQPSTPTASGPAVGSAAVTAATTVTGRRMLGSLEVASVGLGCQTMPGNLYGPVTSREDMVGIVRTAADQGVTFFDTAEAYGPFESEEIVGEGLEPVRDNVVIASKFGWDIDPATGQRTGELNSRPEQIRRAVEGMLQDWGVRKGATPAQISLAWLLAQRPWVVPIPSTTRLPHLLENLATEEVTFNDDELAELTTALDGIEISGDRLPPGVIERSGVEASPA